MENNQERSLVLRPSLELIAAHSARNRILDEMVKGALAMTSKVAPEDVALDGLGELRKDAQAGNAVAQYELGYCYRCGQGVPKNLVEALRWYRMAAEQGDTAAQIELGNLYLVGLGVDEDLDEAKAWYWKAAEKGNDALAQYNLGLWYNRVESVTEDKLQAFAYFQRAADQGLEMAKREAAALLTMMTPDEFRLADALYRPAENYALEKALHAYHLGCSREASACGQLYISNLHSKICDVVEVALNEISQGNLPDRAERQQERPERAPCKLNRGRSEAVVALNRSLDCAERAVARGDLPLFWLHSKICDAITEIFNKYEETPGFPTTTGLRTAKRVEDT